MSLAVKRGRVKGTLTRLKAFAEAITQTTTVEDINTRLEKLEDLWNEFCEIEDELLEEEGQVSEMDEFERKYFYIKARFTHEIAARSPPSTNATDNSVNLNATVANLVQQQHNLLSQTLDRSHVQSGVTHLPRLQIPHFSGDYKEWFSFKDLFQAAVHENEALSASQKFQYLKGALRGNAATVIRHLTISDASYTEAWDILKERFDKKSFIATSFIKTFLEIPAATQPSLKSLRTLCDTLDEVLRGLRALGEDAEQRDLWLIHLTLMKVDSDTRERWAKEVINKDFPTLSELLSFLNKHCCAMESASTVPKRPQICKSLFTSSSNKPPLCCKCSANHFIYQCPQFKGETPSNRRAFVISNSLCFKCLGSNHSVKTCHSKMKCNRCKANHHWLLHDPSQVSQGKHKNASSSVSNAPVTNGDNSVINPIPVADSTLHQASNSTSCSFLAKSGELTDQVSSSFNASIKGSVMSLLPTAQVLVKDNTGQYQKCRILLDSGSQVSLISEACVQRLGLRRQNAKLSISGLSSAGIGVTRGKVSLNLTSIWDSNQHVETIAYIMSNLIPTLPSEDFTNIKWQQIHKIELADPLFNIAAPIDIILGADKFFDVLREDRIQGNSGHPTMQRTIFGWVLSGEMPSQNSSIFNCHLTAEDDIGNLLRTFWETEEVTTEKKHLTEQEEMAENHFRCTHSRSSDGRYVVSLPFKDNVSHLQDSRSKALSRLNSMERRFTHNSQLKEAYVNFMREYETLDHMELVPQDEIDMAGNKCFYLPHHAVFKNSPTPKIRVVFDGSCKTASSIALNDTLIVGPTIQRDISSILLSFRKHQYVFSADVEKMYRQVLVKEHDRDFQRILWRENSHDPLKHYRLKTVTYGTSCAPFLATRALFQVGEEIKDAYPKAAAVIQNDFYIDDLLTGADSFSEALALQQQLVQALEAHGFHLTKWKSNSLDLLNEIQGTTLENTIFSDHQHTSKVLGIQWNPVKDAFTFELNEFEGTPNTKRKILSESSRIFDPLGWLSPITITIKIFFQKLWLLKFEWDEPLPESIVLKWINIRNQLPAITEVSIPRLICLPHSAVELHGFSDASELAYAAVVYCRSVNNKGEILIRILASKTKVSPLKQLSLPRLELSGAVLLTRLMGQIVKALSLQNASLFAWTDSTVLLHWLSDSPRRWKTFIGNRTAEILTTIPRSCWKYVPSKQNPADIASRGMSPTDLATSDLWWNGPKWLPSPESWPIDPTHHLNEEIDASILEERRAEVYTAVPINETTDPLEELLSRISSYSKYLRILGLCHRFIYNCKPQNKGKKYFGFLTTLELQKATMTCLKWVQAKAFSKELHDLRSKKAVSSRSSLSNLHPFCDELGIIRVGGRLQNSNESFTSIHPIILPKSHRVTTLLLKEMHVRYLHPGTSLLISIVRQRYWILGIRNLVRKVNHSCPTCFRYRLRPSQQLMGNLPTPRVTISRPFSYVGVDFAGPITISTRSGRGSKTTKAYIALFVCFAVKAIHLEPVSSLNSEAFVAALRRFAARRGVPKEIFCDNGTNFVGGKRHLTELHHLALSHSKDPIISDFLLQNRIQWHFSPPAAPHFGGLWEAGVKSVKWHLRRVVGQSILGFEELSTLLSQIEAVLNSRPLAAISSDSNDFGVLTPSHFLIGDAITSIPEPDRTTERISLANRWRHIQAMMQGFWKRWRFDYLSSLQQRSKWQKDTEPIKENDLVLLHEENLPPTQWRLGRVVSTHPGRDGRVRVVTLRTVRGLIKRPVHKISKLPTADG